ncbi:MAG: exodeoxyribonuclease VII large subunit [Spirochaetes bacterium]|nr:exodeoxyribonuclease VII large subunit [Spirochaetota bacterium]
MLHKILSNISNKIYVDFISNHNKISFIMMTVYTISEITRLIKKTIQESPDLNSVWIKGEISNLTYHSSGHIYFSLKDSDAVVSAAFFKYTNRNLSFKLEEGMTILAFGSINIFEKRGTYQFIVAEVRLEGIGELLKRIEQLKKRLLEEGVFDASHKKRIPFLPRRLGIVTSPTGAAVRDIIKVAMRRFPNIEIVLAPAKVQGALAAESIVRGIEELNNPEHGIDVIIAGRGGGSFEDLMAFNEEIVVRSFFASRVPIISAVGHQVDHPLSDEAADYAAPTPSAAAEIAIPVKNELIDYIDGLYSRSVNALNYSVKDMQSRIARINDLRVFKNPMEIVHNAELILSDIESRILSSMKEITAKCRNSFLALPDNIILIKNILRDKAHKLEIAYNIILNLSPAALLAKGYSLTMDMNGRIIKSIEEIKEGANISTILKDGSFASTVNSVTKEVYIGKER